MTNQQTLEKWRESSRNYRLNHLELTRQKCRDYKAKHPDIITKNHFDYLKRTSNKLRLKPDAYRRAITSWSRTIRRRDKSCVICGEINNVEAHHILYKREFPELSLNINNGLLLCKQHHYEVHGKRL